MTIVSSNFRKLMIFVFVCLSLQVASGNYYLGFDGLTYKNPENDQCLVTLKYSMGMTTLDFAQQALNRSCALQKLKFSQLFSSETVDFEIKFPDFDTTNVTVKSLPATEVVKELNGTACMIVSADVDLHICSLNFAGFPIFIEIYGLNSSRLETSKTKLMIPGSPDTVLSDDQYNNLTHPEEAPAYYFGTVHESCFNASNNSNIRNLDTNITYRLDKTASIYINGLVPQYAIVKRINSTSPGDYIVVDLPRSNPNPIDPGAGVNFSTNCYQLDFNYSLIVANATYCQNGCRISFLTSNDPLNLGLLQFGTFYTPTDIPADEPVGITGNNGSETGTNFSDNNGSTNGNTIDNQTKGTNSTNNNSTIYGTDGESSSSENSVPVAAIVVPSFAGILILVIIAGCLYKKIKKKKESFQGEDQSRANLGRDLVVVHDTIVNQAENYAPAASDAFMNSYICTNCNRKRIDIAFTPCNHAVCCHDCVKNQSICPSCRNPVDANRQILILPTLGDYRVKIPDRYLDAKERFDQGSIPCFSCVKKNVNVLFLPCAHLSICEDCSRILTHCPFCNQIIIEKKKVTFPYNHN